jgi:hypothetical protein
MAQLSLHVSYWADVQPVLKCHQSYLNYNVKTITYYLNEDLDMALKLRAVKVVILVSLTATQVVTAYLVQIGPANAEVMVLDRSEVRMVVPLSERFTLRPLE